MEPPRAQRPQSFANDAFVRSSSPAGNGGAAAESTRPPSIPDAIIRNLEAYFADLDGLEPGLIYDMVISAVEKPMLEVVMKKADGNQLRASLMLGINRNTLRKKLNAYGLLNGQ